MVVLHTLVEVLVLHTGAQIIKLVVNGFMGGYGHIYDATTYYGDGHHPDGLYHSISFSAWLELGYSIGNTDMRVHYRQNTKTGDV